MDVQDADRRMSRALDRVETQGPEYRRRLRDGFLAEAALSAGKIHVVDASRSIDEVHTEIWQVAAQELGLLTQ
jgi:dTMP kinase